MSNQSRADSESFIFDAANDTTALGPGPYGTLTVNRTDSTHATLTFSANAGYFFQQGAAGFGVNANGQAEFVFPAGSPFSGDTSGNVDGRGVFSNIAVADGTQPTSGTITLHALNGNTWATVANVLLANNVGNFAEAHLNNTNGPPTARTGFVSTSGPVPSPEFGSATLMLALLAGFAGLVGWNRFRAPAVA
jgi:hypothetical protein